ncbi:ornithine cyclodeaminase family protein [Nocardioides fonticola]|uniref:Ornithine cyclodeaminase family protein n=1 Tax=Nocardioides fonticola TaxID=450363 RepID=A0ABP7XM91_9ACTN
MRHDRPAGPPADHPASPSDLPSDPGDQVWLRFVSGPDIEAIALTPAEIVEAVADVVAAHGRGETVFEPRTHLVTRDDGRGHFNVLRGHVSTLGERGVAGVKVVGDFVDNHTLGLPSELALLTLYDPTTGVPLAILDATLITEVRTGAMTAVGARHLARRDARVLGHVGARGTAFSNVVMLDAAFDLEEIRVTSRRPESREAFAERLREVTSTPVVVTDSIADTLAGADIAVEATRLVEPAPLVTCDLLAPGSLLIPYGTVSALAPDLLDVVDKVVVDDWREAQAGEFGALRPHLRSGALTRETLHAEIGEIATGARPGREDDAERILFWHRGLSILDVAVGHLLLRRAEAAGLGTLVRMR